jgi:hypothetical protein
MKHKALNQLLCAATINGRHLLSKESTVVIGEMPMSHLTT